FANVDTEKRHRVHERSSAENEKSPASVNLQGFSVRLTISLNPAKRWVFLRALSGKLQAAS
ncbi:hypothetical protein, partial [Pseudomonas fluorescens]|uniref:hypothetical protein n=1 Tax=Pseudomonas fluorescens TaxID=294 RepID=UPI001E4977D1